MITSIEDLLTELRRNHPDKMLLDDFDKFTRGKLAGHIEVIEEIEMLIQPEQEEADDGEPRY